MPSISKAVVDADLRERVFNALIVPEDTEFVKITIDSTALSSPTLTATSVMCVWAQS